MVEDVDGGYARAIEGLELYAKIFHVDAESKRLGESIERRLSTSRIWPCITRDCRLPSPLRLRPLEQRPSQSTRSPPGTSHPDSTDRDSDREGTNSSTPVDRLRHSFSKHPLGTWSTRSC